MSSRIERVTWPPEDTTRVIAEAYAVRNRTGSDLLFSMGLFDLWRGNLAEMRGDVPQDPTPMDADAADADRFLQTLAVSRSLEYLDPRCEEVIRLTYVEGRSAQQVAEVIETTSRYAEKRVPYCTLRLFEIAEKIYRALTDPSAQALDHAERDISTAAPFSSRAGYEGTPAEHK
jgi:hypothetical protein